MDLVRYIGVLLLLSLVSKAIAEEPISPIQWPHLITDEIRLGKALFFDKSLSNNGQINCASCHRFNEGGAMRSSFSPGPNNQVIPLNTPSIFNLAFNHTVGWTGRFRSYDKHMQNFFNKPKIMGTTWEEVLSTLRGKQDYLDQFSNVHNDIKETPPEEIITKERVAQAIVVYQNALKTPSPFDRFLLGDKAAISEQAKQGYQLFKDFGCISCHQGANIGGNLFQKLGIVEEYKDDHDHSAAVSGLYSSTNEEHHRRVYRVPSLRNVADTAPYFHDGEIPTLEDAIKIMGRYQIGRNIKPEEVDRLVAFLTTLSGAPHPELAHE